jgi:ubiquinone/menaquinone biosynthesis C-methylase UbiE
MMKRELTNRIRYFLDEFLPPIIRDSRWFMWPFYVAAYGRLSVNQMMNFKSCAYAMSAKQYTDFYANLGNSVSRRRETDLNEASIQWLLGHLPPEPSLKILDVGSGNGYLLHRIDAATASSQLTGVDVAMDDAKLPSGAAYQYGMLPTLPFADGEFDIVTCTHVMEHVTDPQASADELLRITKNRLYVVVPRQRYYYYTLDEHLNFYLHIEPLAKLFSRHKVEHWLIDGDWALMVTKI